MNDLNSYFSALYELSAEMAPYLLLGFLFAGILHEYIRHDQIVRYLGGNNLKSALYAALLGVPLPLCSCGVIPTGIAFYREGASKPATISFLISTPQTGVDSVLVTWSLLGWPMAVIRPLVAFITGVVGGMAAMFGKSANNVEMVPRPVKVPGKVGFRWIRMLKYAFVDFMEDIAKWLLIGLLLAALMAVLIPDGFFTQYLDNQWLGMLVVLVAAIPLYVCATGSVPIAAVLLMKGLSPGAALVFLMAGPATNIATITLIGKTLGRRALVTYLASIIGGALFFGFVTDWILPADYFLGMVNHAGHHQQHHLIPEWINVASLIILGVMMMYALIKKYIPMNQSKKNAKDSFGQDGVYRFKVSGMTCNHCKASVEQTLSQMPGTTDVIADVHTGTVTMTIQQPDPKAISEKLEALGYSFGGEISPSTQS